MKEVIKNDKVAHTDILDPSGKPYLVLDQNSGVYHVLYWKAWFSGPRWVGSDWYDEPNPQPNTKPSRKANGFPKRKRVWELPGVEYAPAKMYTHEAA